MQLFEILIETLRKEPTYFSDDGSLKKWVVITKAQNFDESLIDLLLENEVIKSTFFKLIKDVLVFNLNLFIEFLEQKNFVNDSYTKYGNKVGLTINQKHLNQRNEVVLSWPYKDCILEGGQNRDEDKREEIFFNEILAQDEITQLLEPKVLTNYKRITNDNSPSILKGWQLVDGVVKKHFNRKPDGTIADNLIIKGNNLLALHTLNEQFNGKIKLVYIDPPYNTGNDSFGYNDRFNHSTWLTFMKNRLVIAKQLLKDDGVIFVQCDDNEQAYLKVLMDEIFGRENFLAEAVVVINRGGRDYGGIARTHEYLLIFKKSESCEMKGVHEKNKKFPMYDEIGGFEPRELRNRNILFNTENRPNLYYPFYINPQNIDQNGLYELSLEKKENWIELFPIESQGIKTVWRWGKEKSTLHLNQEIKGKAKAGGGFMIIQKYRSFEKMQRSIFDDKEFVNERGTEHIKEMFGKKEFSYPKSEFLINRIIEISTAPGDIVLDYHLGSGTTAAVAHKMGRQYISIEQMDYIETITVERMKKVIEGEQGGISKAVGWQGGGEFVYFELKQYNQLFIDRIISAEDTESILVIWEDMKEKSFLNYNVDLRKHEKHLEEFKLLDIDSQKKHLIGLLDKNKMYVNISSINDEDYQCSYEEKRATRDFYGLLE